MKWQHIVYKIKIELKKYKIESKFIGRKNGGTKNTLTTNYQNKIKE